MARPGRLRVPPLRPVVSDILTEGWLDRGPSRAAEHRVSTEVHPSEITDAHK